MSIIIVEITLSSIALRGHDFMRSTENLTPYVQIFKLLFLILKCGNGCLYIFKLDLHRNCFKTATAGCQDLNIM